MKHRVEIVIRNGGGDEDPAWATFTVLAILCLYIFTLFI